MLQQTLSILKNKSLHNFSDLPRGLWWKFSLLVLLHCKDKSMIQKFLLKKTKLWFLFLNLRSFPRVFFLPKLSPAEHQVAVDGGTLQHPGAPVPVLWVKGRVRSPFCSSWGVTDLVSTGRTSKVWEMMSHARQLFFQGTCPLSSDSYQVTLSTLLYIS